VESADDENVKFLFVQMEHDCRTLDIMSLLTEPLGRFSSRVSTTVVRKSFKQNTGNVIMPHKSCPAAQQLARSSHQKKTLSRSERVLRQGPSKQKFYSHHKDPYPEKGKNNPQKSNTNETYNDFPFLVHQALAQFPKLDLALRSLDSRLCALDTIFQYP
jgi:hypothetical protein